jgi:sugar phosphate isomerase/epimerase
MKILFFKSKWEAPNLSLEEYLDRVKSDGFDGAELFVPGRPETPQQIRDATSSRGLGLVTQIVSSGETLEEHQESLDRNLRLVAECAPRLVNCHGGSDLFDHEVNRELYKFGIDLAESLGVKICFETHRARPTFSGPSTRRLLEAIPGLRLTADFSHWMCVHESLLANQAGTLAVAIERTDHIHARVGFQEGPQVGNPMAPENAELREIYLGWWRQIIDVRAKAGDASIAITPEAGPPGYMPVVPFENRPVAGAWEVNVAVRNWLRKELS